MYESPITLLKTDPFIQRIKDETDTMIFQGVARVGVHVDKDELIKALEYDRGQYEKGFHDGRMYVPPCPSNADRIRSMTDEELAEFCFRITDDVASYYGGDGYEPKYPVAPKGWLDWLRQEANDVGQ